MLMTKAEIRAIMKVKRNSLSKEQQSLFSSAIHSRLFETEAYQQVDSIFTFISMQSEVDTRNIIDKAFLDHKKVFVPRVEGKKMQFYEIHDMSSLVISKFGVLEPDQSYTEPYTKYEKFTQSTIEFVDKSFHNKSLHKKLMLLPGLAFDSKGNRIGYGAGYYDRFLEEYKEHGFIKAALAYDFQILEQVETEVYDVRADLIVTPEVLIECQQEYL